MYSSIITALKNLIDDITSVQAIYDSEPTEITEYPAVILLPDSHRESYANLRDNRVDVTIIIRVYGQLDATHSTSQVKVREVADSIIAKLAKQTNITLGGLVDFSTLTDATFRFGKGKAQLYICEMRYKCAYRINRYA
jgi:hypothetical protein